jgi:FixJ family two-component response regulator
MSNTPESAEAIGEPATSGPVVFVIDDSPSVRSALKDLFESVGLHTELFTSAGQFLENANLGTASCLVLDVRLRGMNGLDLQDELAKAEVQVPVVFITAHGDIAMASAP